MPESTELIRTMKKLCCARDSECGQRDRQMMIMNEPLDSASFGIVGIWNGSFVICMMIANLLSSIASQNRRRRAKGCSDYKTFKRKKMIRPEPVTTNH